MKKKLEEVAIPEEVPAETIDVPEKIPEQELVSEEQPKDEAQEEFTEGKIFLLPCHYLPSKKVKSICKNIHDYYT